MAQRALHPVSAAEKYGLIFVRLAEGPPIAVDEFLGQGRNVRQSILPSFYIFPNTVLTFPHDHMTLTQVFPAMSATVSSTIRCSSWGGGHT
ncbi:MAG: hypothetical protein ABW034_09140 [Steroidobacteraceae bacterium]